MCWTTERKSWSLPVHVSSARNNVFLWLWINCFPPGNFLPEEISKSCPPIVIVNGFWFCFNFHGNRKFCFLSDFAHRSLILISMGSFEYTGLHFYSCYYFETLPLTSWLHLIHWNPVCFFLDRTDMFLSYFLNLSDIICFSVLISAI